ncbi:MAG: 30S ribosomal protein S4 [Candidatus Peregrinibacteria bacterium]|nr:30S ribosomal protein S4 [Candidatus Peregrinibacteria bacterium]
MKYTGPVCRLCRREGEKLFLKGARCESNKCAITKGRPGPGQHGLTSASSKKSEYAKQMRAKQKAKRIFGLNERAFSNYYEKAADSQKVTGNELLRLLEQRLDNVVYRSGIASSRAQARQLIGHGLCTLNGKKIDIPSIQVRVGDKFEVRDARKKMPILMDASAKKPTAPRWIKVDLKNLSGEVIAQPEKDDFEKTVDSQYIIEYYSK